MQDAQLVGHRVPAPGRRTGAVQLVQGVGQASRQRHPARLRQRCGRRGAGHLALQPHPERRDHSHRLRDGDAVRARLVESAGAERLEEVKRPGIRTPGPGLGDERDDLRGRIGAPHLQIVLDQAATPGLVAQSDVTGVQVAFDFVGIERPGEQRHARICTGAEWIQHHRAHG